MRMIDTYSITSARQLTPGQQLTIVDDGVGQSDYLLITYRVSCLRSCQLIHTHSAALCQLAGLLHAYVFARFVTFFINVFFSKKPCFYVVIY